MKKTLKAVVASVIMAGGLFNANIAVAKKISEPTTQVTTSTNQVKHVSIDNYGYKIIGKKNKIDTVILGEVVEVDKKDNYVYVENVFDENDTLAIEFKNLDADSKKVGAILQITIDGASANYDEISEVKLNKSIVEYKGLAVYGQEKYYGDSKKTSDVKNIVKAKKDVYGNKVVWMDKKGVNTAIVGKISSINKKEKYAEIEDVLGKGTLTVDLKYIKDIKNPKGKIVTAYIDGTSANNDKIYKVKLNNSMVKSSHVAVFGQNVYYDAYYFDVN